MSTNEDKGLGDALRVVENLAKAAVGTFVVGEIQSDSRLPGLPAKVPFLVRSGATPSLHSMHPLLEEWRTAPERRAGVATVRTLHSFIDLVCRHKDEGSVLFAQADWPNPSLTAVIDYHTLKGEPRFGRHRVFYPFPTSAEFRIWIERNEKPFAQNEFADFIEANIMDLSMPLEVERGQYEPLFRTQFAGPTDLIALARGLEINVNSRVKNAYRTQSGEMEITFETEHKTAAGDAVHVPGLFMLSCRAFVDGSEVRLPARLRYRVKEGVVTWSYSLYKWEDALRNRVCADLLIATEQTELPSFEGAPEVEPSTPAPKPVEIR